MPGYLLHSGATVMCIHGGNAQPLTSNPRVKVGGHAIVVQSDLYAIDQNCSLGLTGTAPPCKTAQWVYGATRVLVGGVPVLLQDSQAICTPTGTSLNIVTTQQKVKGM